MHFSQKTYPKGYNIDTFYYIYTLKGIENGIIRICKRKEETSRP